MENKKIVIAGGNGFLGQLLSKHFLDAGFHIVNLNRHRTNTEGRLIEVKWDGKNLAQWKKEVDGAFAVINLVGRSVDCRYNEKNKKAILSSRLDSTEAIGKAIKMAKSPPKLWINASSATIYEHTLHKEMDEIDGDIGNDFSETVCKSWEAMAIKYKTYTTRQVLLRTSLVLGNEGGVFPVLTRLVKLGLGGKQGKGKQFVSWIHAKDFIRAVHWIIVNEKINGPINCTAPYPIINKKFMQSMRKQHNVLIGLPANKCMLEVGAFLLQTETELILKSRKVVPQQLLQSGFQFNHPTIEDAIQQLIHEK